MTDEQAKRLIQVLETLAGLRPVWSKEGSDGDMMGIEPALDTVIRRLDTTNKHLDRIATALERKR